MGKSKVIDFLNGFFENMNVYRSVMLYDDQSSKRMCNLRKKLEKHDYSMLWVDTSTRKEDIMTNRMFLCHIGAYDDFKIMGQEDQLIQTINVVFCLNNKIYKQLVQNKPHCDNALLLKL